LFKRTRAFACFAAALMLALPAFSQGIPNGKLSGRVTAEGAVLPGVMVTVTSPALQGERTTTTTGAGDFLFPSLPPGTYRVVFALEGMENIERQVQIAAAQTAQMDVEMNTSFTEEIVVTGTAALESISESTQGAVTYGKGLIDELPAGRTLNQIVALSPGVQPNGPTKDAATGLSNITVSGAPTYENLFLLNGVVLNENIRGQALDLFIEEAIQETTTITSGVSAEYGRFSGGVVNVITKSGGNDFSGSFRTTLRNQDWEETTRLTTVQTDKVIPTYELTLGGPIVRDRLWFFLAGRDREAEESRNVLSFPSQGITGASYVNLRDQQRYEAKLTGTITPRHTVIGTYMNIEDTEGNNAFTGIMDLASLNDRATPQTLAAINYAGSFGSNFLLTAQYSEREFTFEGSGGKSRDLIAGTVITDRSRGGRYHAPTFCGICTPEERNNENLLLKGSYFLSTNNLGSHEFVAGYDTFDDVRLSNNHQSGSDWIILGTTSNFVNGVYQPVFNANSTFLQFWPVLQPSQGTSFVTNSYFLNDSWRVNDRLSLNLGVRYDENDGKNAIGQKVADDSKISPRVGGTFDTFGDGRLMFHANYGQYVAALANTVGDRGSPGGVPSAFQWTYTGPTISGLSQDDALRAIFNWFAGVNGGLPTVSQPLGGNGAFNLLSGVAIRGVNERVEGSLDSPSVEEFSIGASFQLGSKGMFRADYVHRDWEDFYSFKQDTTTGRVTAPVGSLTLAFDLGLVVNNNSLYEREYDGLHTQFRYRINDRIDLGGNWTLSKTEGNVNGENQGSGPLLGGLESYPEYFEVEWAAPTGYLQIDQRHRVNLYSVIRLLQNDRHSLNVGLLQTYQSGHPYEAAGTITLANPAGGSYVTNPGYVTPPTTQTYFFSDRGEFTTPDITRTNLSIDYMIRFGSFEVFVKPEVINVFDEEKIDTTDVRYFNTSILTANSGAAGLCPSSPTGRCLAFNPFTETPVEGVHWAKGPTFGQATNALAFQQPRTYLFTLGFRF
jgi:hypothetical protein